MDERGKGVELDEDNGAVREEDLHRPW